MTGQTKRPADDFVKHSPRGTCPQKFQQLAVRCVCAATLPLPFATLDCHPDARHARCARCRSQGDVEVREVSRPTRVARCRERGPRFAKVFEDSENAEKFDSWCFWGGTPRRAPRIPEKLAGVSAAPRSGTNSGPARSGRFVVPYEAPERRVKTGAKTNLVILPV